MGKTNRKKPNSVCLKSKKEELNGIEIYECKECSFITKSKLHMQMHQNLHKNANGVTFTKTRRKEELKAYKCPHCSFSSNYKCSVRKHAIKQHNLRLKVILENS